MSEGKSFHIHALVTGKARRPTVESLTAGTDRLSVVEDRNLCRVFVSLASTNQEDGRWTNYTLSQKRDPDIFDYM